MNRRQLGSGEIGSDMSEEPGHQINGRSSLARLSEVLLGSLILHVMLLASAIAQSSLCATVKIQIEQELTLERQAFDARMRISNGLDTFPLQNLRVLVAFSGANGAPATATSDPDDDTADFFIRADSMSGIGDIDGGGTVPPASSAEIHWLIVPSSSAAGGEAFGRRYLVGATLSYVLGGEQKTLEVTPDTITVLPQPRLVLDYFLTRDVYGDDPLTAATEVSEPFSFGARVTNTALGVARNVAIESAQPRIVENDQGLLVGFRLLGSSVDDQPVAPSASLGLWGRRSSVGARRAMVDGDDSVGRVY